MVELLRASEIVSYCDEGRMKKKFNLKFFIRAETCGAYFVVHSMLFLVTKTRRRKNVLLHDELSFHEALQLIHKFEFHPREFKGLPYNV